MNDEGGSAPLYSFNIEELYDYDLPNIRRPSEALTAMSKMPIGTSFSAKKLAPAAAGAPALDAEEEPTDGEARLKNGDDAANFFARNGNHTPVKFVYLNRARTGDEFRPYDLTVVSREQTDPEYFTMSACGCVHVFSAEQKQPSEFIQLSTWMQQSTFFNVLTSIRFFKHYLAARIFRLWRANVRYKLYDACRNKLCKRFFLAKPAFCSTLLEINSLCYDLRTGDKTRLLATISPNFMTIENFLEEQQQQLQHASKAFEQIVDKLQALAEKVCKDVTTRARLTDDNPLMVGRLADGDGNERAPPKKQRSKSMAAVRDEQQQRLAAVKEAQSEERMLGDFIRLADYMSVSCCYLLTVGTSETLLEVLTTPRKNGMWITGLEFGSDDILFQPPRETFTSSLATCLEAMINNIHAVPRLLYMRPFKPYFHSGRVEGPDVAKLVRHSTRFLAAQRSIAEVVTADFERATQYAEIFEEYRVIHCFGEYWNFDGYAERMHAMTSFKEVVVTLKSDMGQLNKWFKELDRMRISGTERNLHVDSKTLKNLLIPITQKALDKCRNLLLQVARDNCMEALQAFQQRIRDLGEQPRTLRDFADYCDNLNRVRDERQDMEERAMQVNEMYDLLDAYEVKIPAADSVKKDDLKEARELLTEKAGEAGGAVEGKMSQMNATLDKSISNLNEDLVSILAGLNSGDYVDPACDPKIVLERLETVSEQMTAIGEKAEGYKAMQLTFNCEPNDFKQHKDTMAAYELKIEVWTKLDTWNESQYLWKSSDFKALDVEAMAKEVGQHYKDVHKMSKRPGPNGMPDPVVVMFKESVEDFKEQMPVIQDLGNNCLQVRHWQKIFERLEQPYVEGNVFSLDQLLRYGAANHADFIGETSSTASGEFGLEQLLQKIRKAWADVAFTTLNHRDQSDVFILGGLDEVIAQLEDSQVALQTILASRFVGGIRTEVEEWEKKLGLLSEVMDEWLTCQRSWMYLENIFGAEDIQKQLPAESSKFSKINKFFLDRMRKTNDQPNVILQVTVPGLLDTFLDANKALDEIQKSLNEYLEVKCAAFPRFYFLSNDELLESNGVTGLTPRSTGPSKALASRLSPRA